MTLLVASILALGIGPALSAVLSRRPETLLALDGCVVVLLGSLVLFHSVPECVEDAGWLALLTAWIGVLIPALWHGPWHHECAYATSTARSFLVIVVGLMALHAFFDGVALVDRSAMAASPSHTSGASLGWAVFLHRILEGLGIGWWVRPHYGPRATLGMIGSMAFATILGFWSADTALHFHQGMTTSMGLIQAMVAGSLLHVLFKHAPAIPLAQQRRGKMASLAGGAAALGLLVCINFHALQQRASSQSALVWTSLVAHLSVPMVLGYGGHLWVGLMASDFFSCGLASLPLARSGTSWLGKVFHGLLKIHWAGIGTCWVLLGAPLGMVYLVSWLGVRGLTWLVMPQNKTASGVRSPERLHASLLGSGLGSGLVQRIAMEAGPGLVMGLVLAAFVIQTVDPSWLAYLRTHHMDVPMAALLGWCVSLPMPAAVGMAAIQIHQGASEGAALAWILISAHVRALAREAPRKPSAWALAGVLTGFAMLVGYGTSFLPTQPPDFVWARPRLSYGYLICMFILASIPFATLLHQGLRPFLACMGRADSQEGVAHEPKLVTHAAAAD